MPRMLYNFEICRRSDHKAPTCGICGICKTHHNHCFIPMVSGKFRKQDSDLMEKRTKEEDMVSIPKSELIRLLENQS